MAAARDRKLYLGPRVRMLRRDLGLNQTEMAAELGISPSYLNHLERNQRPLTAQMLLRLAETYDLDMRGFVAGANEAASSDLHEIFADALVSDIGVARQEVLEVAENYPGLAEAVARLYRALTDLRQLPQRVAGDERGEPHVASPLAWVRQWIEARRNYFGELDDTAEAVSATLGEEPHALREAAVARLRDAHRVAVRIVPAAVIGGARWHYDIHRRRLLVSERLADSGRRFAILRLLAQLEFAPLLTAACDAAAPPSAEAAGLARAMLGNYAAAALAMPYARFHAAAHDSRYDMALLGDRFGASYEQVAHRLTTLQRADARGIEFFMFKVDIAGNIAKRYASAAAPLARFGGGCPRWSVYRGLAQAGETIVDRVILPDGSSYITWGRAVTTPGRTPGHLIVLGCDATSAGAVGYADRVVDTTPIGIACHLCERDDCDDRSLPPITRALELQTNRGEAGFRFRHA